MRAERGGVASVSHIVKLILPTGLGIFPCSLLFLKKKKKTMFLLHHLASLVELEQVQNRQQMPELVVKARTSTIVALM